MNPDLLDPQLFGNEAGEDEPLEVLADYFVDPPTFKPFYDERTKLYFVRSRKGMGKSALLRYTYSKCKNMQPDTLALYVKASDLIAIQDTSSSTPAELINLWQQRICSRINLELGSILKIGVRDDSINLIERAEINGFRGRNLVGSLIDRLKIKIQDFEVSRVTVPEGDHYAILKRFQEGSDIKTWIFIDDIDATFINNEKERLITSTFFSACRNITNSVKDLNIRASVRTDVWHVIAQYDEALDKCEQYMLDLKWDELQSGQIISKKIVTHLKRRYRPQQVENSQKPIHQYVFQDPMIWNGKKSSTFHPVHILSAGRPRWAAQLCRLAAKNAHHLRQSIISIGNINSIMKDYGKSRLSDIYKEHHHQCSELTGMIESFANGPSIYTTADLLHHIYTQILPPGKSIILDGKTQTDKQMIVAQFLFRIGFINARRSTFGAGFISFEDRPHLLTNNLNPDDGCNWEIHPSYRTVLRIKNSAAINRKP